MYKSNDHIHLYPIDQIAKTCSEDPSNVENFAKSCLKSISDNNDRTNAVVWVDEQFVDEEIERVKNLIANADEKFPLAGVPILVKEIDSPIKGTRNSWGNIQLKQQDYRDDITATSVTKLQNAGAVIMGKTNNPELALTVTTKSSAHGPCNNPLDTSKNTGGSSGGSAAAVASGMVSVATGSDGGGSIRIPAAACGVYGFKPSRGVISLGPIFEEFWAGLVCKGLISNDLTNLSNVLNVLADYSNIDDFAILDIPKSQNLKIGVRTNCFASICHVDPCAVQAVDKVADFLSHLGHKISYSSPSSYDDETIIDPFLDIIAYNTFLDIAELSRRLYEEFQLESCESETVYFFEKGKQLDVDSYNSSCDFIPGFTKSIENWFEDFDILITPTIGNVAPAHGEVEKNPELNPFIYSGLTFPSNIAGLPSLTVPVKSHHDSGLPLGIQIISKFGNDDLVLQLGKILESDYSDIFITPDQHITS